MALLVSKDQQDKGDHQAKLGKEVLLGHQVHLVRKENRAQVVQQDLMAQPAQMVPLDREELQDQWDPQVIEAILGTKEDQVGNTKYRNMIMLIIFPRIART